MSIYIVGLFNYSPRNKTCRKWGHDDRVAATGAMNAEEEEADQQKKTVHKQKRINIFFCDPHIYCLAD
jgi:hypothetical protein